MSPFRTLLIFLFGIISGVFCVGVIASLPYPYSEFPVIPVLFSLALILRARPSSFWFLFTMIFVLDLYSGAGFGIGILSFVALVLVGDRVTSDIISHRSLIGGIVISGAMGVLWVLFNAFFSQVVYWMVGTPSNIGFLALVVSATMQGGAAAIVVGLLYAAASRWLRNHSPMVISGRL